MFSVPPGATPGTHQVSVQNSHGTSATLGFVVDNAVPTAPVPPAPFLPRIDAVTLLGARFDATGQVTPLLYVQGANFDVGTIAQVNGVDVPTIAHKGLRNTFYGVAPSDLGYPIYHYLSLVVVPGARSAGAPVSITVRNLGATQTSAAVTYGLPADAAHVDSDGDSLLDSWETGGYDADGDGVVDLDLAALGASPWRRDVLLEVDTMVNAATTGAALQYPAGPATFGAARAMFAAAPVINPASANGINLVIDSSGTALYTAPVCFDLGPDASACNPSVQAFSAIRSQSFDNPPAGREKLFHYAVWAPEEMFHNTGRSDGSRNLLVALEAKTPPYKTVRSQVESLVHELGHDLNQFHGGGPDDFTWFKPNYLSVMSYTWDLRSERQDAWRVDHATCVPFYYAMPGATEVNGALPPTVNTVVDYSQGMGPEVSRGPGASKVCGSLVNFSATGIPNRVSDYANWPNLRFAP